VELPVEGVIAGVRVQGIVDLLDTEGRIIDCKTAARRPGRDHAGRERRLQAGYRHED
jgi:hypothetical protein